MAGRFARTGISEGSVNIIAFVGDVHGQIDRMYDLLLAWQERTGAKLSAIVQVGDFGIFLDPVVASDFHKYAEARSVAPIATYVCPGNHESFEVIRAWQKTPDAIQNMKLLPDGGITEVCGMGIGSAWGNYSPLSWNDPRRVEQSRESENPGRRALHIYRPAVERLLGRSGPLHILVSHDAASCDVPPQFHKPPDAGLRSQLGLDAEETPRGCPGLMAAIDKFQPSRHYFGHYHVHWEAKIFKTRAICLPDIERAPHRFADFFEVKS